MRDFLINSRKKRTQSDEIVDVRFIEQKRISIDELSLIFWADLSEINQWYCWRRRQYNID